MKFIEELYEKYSGEFRARLNGDELTPEQFRARFGAELNGLEQVEIDRPSGHGVLYYCLSEQDGRQICVIPAYGCYASSDRTLTDLFILLSEKLVQRKSTRFQMHFYAHDTASQRLFSMMQFGCMAETGIAKTALTDPRPTADCAIRTLSRAEAAERWDEIWAMTASILRHLQSAPVFYPCLEFTEELYRAYFLDETTHLHVAFDEKGRMIGMIETNAEPNAMLRDNVPSANIGEIYVEPARRGSGLSDSLFRHALAYEKEHGTDYLWVEHGTANPNARGFWGRYFDTYEYELDRFIEAF